MRYSVSVSFSFPPPFGREKHNTERFGKFTSAPDNRAAA
jgi:hypothetical protein